MTTTTLERIAKLLNQAENAGTEAEAATFMAKAQSMATMYSVDLAKARHATKAKERTVPEQRSMHIGKSGSRGLRTLVDLYLGIARANDIKCTIAHNATYVYGVGFAEDLDIAEALYASLVTQQAKAADDFKRNGDWREEKIWVETGGWSGGEYKPQTWLTARLNFQDAFASRVGARLSDAKWAEERRIKDAEAEAARRPHLDTEGTVTEAFSAWLLAVEGIDLDDLADDTGTIIELAEMLRDVDNEWTQEILARYAADLAAQSEVAGTGLVLVEKRKAVDEAYAPMLKRARGSYRGGTSGASSNSGRSAGRAAGDRASLGGGKSIGGSRGAISA
jgi:hypothetical protein